MGAITSFLNRFFPRWFSQPEFQHISRQLGYYFNDYTLLEHALTHPSLAREQTSHLHTYERLEFLGDAILELIVSDYLFQRYQNVGEGDLTKMRAAMVNQESLAEAGRRINLSTYIRTQDVPNRPIEESEAVISDVIEAIIGAIYIDSGLDSAKKVIRRLQIITSDSAIYRKKVNYKGHLIEYCHNHDLPEPEFQITDTTGPEHSRKYKVAVLFEDEVYESGEGSSKKKAGQVAAQRTLTRLRSLENSNPP